METNNGLPGLDGQESEPAPRRPFLLEAGEPLVVPHHPIEAAVRYRTFMAGMGLAEQDVLVSELMATPIPYYPAEFPDGRKRWVGTHPEMMWHPLMWLPRRVAFRYTLVEPDGSQRFETDDEWVLRVAIEMTTAGLYDETTGTWLDVCAMAGLDVGNEADTARIEEWMAGADDEILDGVSLDEMLLNVDDPAWAVDVVAGWIDDIRVIVFASGADGLLETCWTIRAAAEKLGDENVEELRKGVANVARFAQRTFAGLNEDEMWAELVGDAERFTGTAAGLIDGPYRDLVGRLETVRDTYWPVMETLTNDPEVTK